MYAVGDAYKAHTECIQAHKEVKREEFLFYFFFILPVLLSLLLVSSGIPQRTVNDFFTACHCGQWAFSGFHRPSDGLSAIIPTHS